jgi:hypothetical protein
VTAEGLTERTMQLYSAAEQRLMQLISDRMRKGLDAPRWAEDKLAELQQVRAEARAVMARVEREALAANADAYARAYRRGMSAAEGELSDLGIDAGEAGNVSRAIARLAQADEGRLAGVSLRVVRATADAYRAAVVRASAGTLLGATTRLQDAQLALNQLAAQGITAFTDTAGRNWSLPSYVEMATRTTTAQAAVLGHLDRLEAGGIPLVIVSDSPNECELCAPWEGKVLSRGPVGALQRNALTGAMEAVPIDGTVDEATADGLFHPNCTHNLSGYIHGVTQRGQATSNPEGYADRQRQRELERRAREAKRRQSVAISPEAKTRADARVREVNGQLAEHSAATGQPRKRNRETPGKAR